MLGWMLLSSFLLGAHNPVPAENSFTEAIIREMVKNGFENVIVKVSEARVLIAYENRVFRFDVEALREIVKIAAPVIANNQLLVMVPKNRNIPIAVIEISGAECKKYASGKLLPTDFGKMLNISFNTDSINDELKDIVWENSSFARFDIALKPGLKFEFGPYSEPVRYQLNLLPEVRTSLWKGMSLSYEFVVPVKNDFNARYDSVRTGVVVLNQTLRLENSLFVSSSVGIFTQDRYGADIEARKYFLNGDLSVGANAGYTSSVSFSGFERIHYSKDFILTGSVGVEYRIENFDLTVGVSAGKYLNADKSIRFDINREFGETEIGFFALRSNDGINNGGISISIPLFPSREFNPGLIRVTSGENFNTSYIVKSNPRDLIGLRYNTRNRIDSFVKKLNPSFIKNNF